MIDLSPQQQTAIDALLSGKNVFLTGEAGSGKTTVIKEFIARSRKQVAIVAPTGIAAINSGGQTIHSFFMFKPCLLTEDNIEPLVYKSKRQILRQLDVLVIDEISMVRSDLFTAIDFRLREIATGSFKHIPFGGKQIVVCGDFYQLPPIANDKVEIDWLNENLNGLYAFQTDLWKNANFQNILLEDQFRQKDDSKFIEILNKIRNGEISKDSSSIDKLNDICLNQTLARKPVSLCTTNSRVNCINEEEKSKLSGETFIFTANVKGQFNQKDYPTDFILELKKGIRVMVLNNKRLPDKTFEYVNGDVGTVIDVQEDSLKQKKVIVKFDSGRVSSIGISTWCNTKYVVEVDQFSKRRVIRQEEIGQFSQIPLRLAYAITIHKSQGLTLENVLLDTGNGCFSHGQLYTALSRCRSLKGLCLKQPLMNDDLILDDEVVDFYNSIFKKKEERSTTLSIDIPLEYKDKIEEYIKNLKLSTDLNDL